MTHTEEQLTNAILPWSLLWLGLWVGDILGGLLTNSSFYDLLLNPWLRVALSIHDAMVISVVVLCAALLWRIPDGALKSLPSRVRRSIGFLALYVLVLLSVTSWALYYRLGTFLNLTIVKMVLHDPRQMLGYGRHDQLTLLQIPFFSMLFTILLKLAISKAGRLPLRIKKRLLATLAGLGIAASFLLVSASLFIHIFQEGRVVRDAIGNVYLLPEYYAFAASEKSSPFLRFNAELKDSLAPQGPNIATEKFRVRQLPIISLEEYLQGAEVERIKKHNVLFIMIESLRKDVFPVYGGARNVMPTVQTIASDSLVFEHAYSQSSHSSYADTAPLSSTYPLRSGSIYFYPEAPSYPRVLFYDILKPLGYQTSIFSSQDLDWSGVANFLRTNGLDYFFDANMWTGSKKIVVPNEGDLYAELMLSGKKRSEELDDSITVTSAIEWIKARKKDAPFAMFLDLQNSHYPYSVPPGFPQRFLQEDPEHVEQLMNKMRYSELPMSVIYDKYCDSLAYIDYGLGLLVKTLKDEQVWDDTIVILTGDTATAFGGTEGRWGGTLGNGAVLVEEVVNVPLIVSAPNLAPGLNLQNYVQHIDILPTLLELLGLPAHPAFQGKSMLSRPEDDSGSIYMVAQSPFAHQYATIKDRWKLVYDKPSDKYTLIDLSASATESVRPHDGALAVQLQEQLQAWIKLQIDYYENDRHMHSRYYPPVIEE